MLPKPSRNVSSAVYAFVALLLGACGGGLRETPRPKPSATASALLSAPPSASVVPPPLVPSLELTHAAGTLDPVDLSSAAASLGADRLIAFVDDPRVAAAALQAIAYADDSEVVFARLARRAREQPDDAHKFLDVFERALERPSRRGEILDDEGIHAAVADLRTIAASSAHKPDDRALATSILRRLADRGFADTRR